MSGNSVLDIDPSVEKVCAAIYSMNHNPDVKEKEAASRWLHQFQKSVLAWKICDEILHSKKDTESRYIAILTIKTKIQTSFSELPKEAHVSLRDSLLEHVSNVNTDTESLITKQLSVAVGDMVLLMPEWKTAISDLIAKFGNANHAHILIEILSILPEEVKSRWIILGSIRRKEIDDEFSNRAEELLNCLNAFASVPRLHIPIVNCIRSWIDARAIPIKEIGSDHIITLAFRALLSSDSSPLLHQAATDCVCSLLFRLEEEVPPEAPLNLDIYRLMKSLEDPYLMSLATEDSEKSINYCRIFTEYVESTLERVMSNPSQPHYSLEILDSVLVCCGHPDYDLADVTFNVWYRISEECERSEELMRLFKPYIERLIYVLCKHCQMEPDTTDLLTEYDEFQEFRSKSSCLLMSVSFIVGSNSIFEYMFNSNLKSPGASWEIIESALFVMSSVAKTISPKENVFVPLVIDSVIGLPQDTHIAVKNTLVKLIGKLGYWINANPVYLERVLQFMLKCIHDPKLVHETSKALQNICSSCQNHMVSHLDGIIYIIQSADNFKLNNSDILLLLKGASNVISVLDPLAAENGVKSLCMDQNSKLYQSLESKNGDPIIYLDRLANILRNVDFKEKRTDMSRHPCFEAIQEFWPTLIKVFKHYHKDARVMEKCCRTVRFAIRSTGVAFAPLVGDTVNFIVELYQSYPHCCFLYLGSILVDEFGTLEGCIPGLINMLERMIPISFNLLQGPNGLQNNPDTVDDFFRFNLRFIQKNPIPYLRSSFTKSVIECGIMSVSLDHPAASASLMKFFTHLIQLERLNDSRDFETKKALVSALRQEFGPSLLDRLITSSVSILPITTFQDIGEVIFELLRVDRTATSNWLEITLTGLNSVNENGLQAITKEHIFNFHKEVTTSKYSGDVERAIHSFAKLWK